MASPWRDVISCFKDVVQAFKPGRSVQAALPERQSRARSFVEAASQALLTKQGLGGHESRELAALLALLGDSLAALNASLSSKPVAADLLSAVIVPAALALSTAAELLEDHAPPGPVFSHAQARSLFSSLQLIADVGRQALTAGLAQLQGGPVAGAGTSAGRAALVGATANALFIQASALEHAAALAIAPDSGGADAAFAARVPARLLVGWLRAAMTSFFPALDSLAGTDPQARSVVSHARKAFAALLGNVYMLDPPFQTAYSEAIAQEAQLPGALFSAVVPVMREWSVALTLPPERWPQGLNWRKAARTANFLSVLSELPSVRQLLGLPGGTASSGSAGGGANASGGSSGAQPEPRLLGMWLQAAAQLTQHAPLERDESQPAGASLKRANVNIAFQLAQACSTCTKRMCQPGGAFSSAELQRHARLLLPTVPALGRLLRLHLWQPMAATAAAVCLVTAPVIGLLAGLARGIPQLWACPLEDVTDWCQGAASALQLLPLAADAAQVSGPLARELAKEVARLAQNLAHALSYPEQSLPHPEASVRRSLPGALAALWQLHSDTCRAVHFVQREGRQAQLLCDEGAQLNALFGLLVTCLNFAAGMTVAGALEKKPAEARMLQSMCVAQLAALPPLLSMRGWRERCSDGGVCLLLLNAVSVMAMYGPVHLSSSPELHGLMELIARSLPQAPDVCQLFFPCLYRDLSNASLRHMWPAALASGLAEGLLDVVTGQYRWKAELCLAALVVAMMEAASEAAASEDAASEDAQLLAAVHGKLAAVETALAGVGAVVTSECIAAHLASILPAAKQLAHALLAWQRRPEAAAAARLEQARAAAARGCAYLRCANLRLEGGPAARDREGSRVCGRCKAVWYCDATCSHADWRWAWGHKRMCAALGEARLAERRQGKGEGQAGEPEGPAA